MDSTADKNLTVLVTGGQGQFTEQPWQCPSPGQGEIRVRSIFTGVCRSDIDLMQGLFHLPDPVTMSGHEGLAEVIELGAGVTDVNIGDFVATRGEPAYADEYCVKAREYVWVPEAVPKYILEPVACGINCVTQCLSEYQRRQGQRLLIAGTGFLAGVVYDTIRNLGLDFDIEVLGTHNKQRWGDLLVTEPRGQYGVIIDLSGRDLVNQDIFADQALYVYAAQKMMNTDLRYLLWRASTIVCPSPRTDNFYSAMVQARDWIQSGELSVEDFWTKEYKRADYATAFRDGVNRPKDYSRGYISWR